MLIALLWPEKTEKVMPCFSVMSRFMANASKKKS
jgi:hypothetical protein